jgi:uncharacterized membrane protein YqjE
MRMTGQKAAEQQSATPETGFVENVRALGAGMASYLAARLRLAGMESREAAWHFLWILLWLLAALGAIALGYLLLVVALVFLLSQWTGWAWQWVLLATAGAHLAAALIFALIIRSRLQTPVFNTTIQEFKRDQEWLTTTSKQRQS